MEPFKKDLRAARTDDELPLRSYAGVGPKGDSFKIDIEDDEVSEADTRLVGSQFDEATKQWIELWRSANINGGRLYVSEAINIMENPKTFRLTFSYERPDRKHWALTTPAIPYMYDHPRRGSDVADLYLKDHSKIDDEGNGDMWKDVLVYDQDLPRKNFNPPSPYGGISKVSDTPVPTTHKGEGWSISLDIVEFEELVKISGWSYQDLIKSINWETGRWTDKPLQGKLYPDTRESNLLDFIERLVKNEEEQRKEEIERLEKRIKTLEKLIASMQGQYDEVIKAIVAKFFGNHNVTITEKPLPARDVPIPTTYQEIKINWQDENKAAVGNLNVFSNPSSDTKAYSLRTRADDSRGDLRFK